MEGASGYGTKPDQFNRTTFRSRSNAGVCGSRCNCNRLFRRHFAMEGRWVGRYLAFTGVNFNGPTAKAALPGSDKPILFFMGNSFVAGVLVDVEVISCHVDHPGHAKTVGEHAKGRGKEGLGQRHLNLPTVGQGREQTLRFGIAGHGNGSEKP